MWILTSPQVSKNTTVNIQIIIYKNAVQHVQFTFKRREKKKVTKKHFVKKTPNLPLLKTYNALKRNA